MILWAFSDKFTGEIEAKSSSKPFLENKAKMTDFRYHSATQMKYQSVRIMLKEIDLCQNYLCFIATQADQEYLYNLEEVVLN